MDYEENHLLYVFGSSRMRTEPSSLQVLLRQRCKRKNTEGFA